MNGLTEADSGAVNDAWNRVRQEARALGGGTGLGGLLAAVDAYGAALVSSINPQAFKAFSTLQAVAAMQGVQLNAIRNDAERWSFIATVGAVTREFQSFDDVRVWLQSAEGAAADCMREGEHA